MIAIVFGFLWARDATKEFRGEPVDAIEPEPGGPPESTDAPADQGEAAMPAPETGERFPRNRFLEGATLGLGAVIGGLVTVPAIGFMIVPAFKGQGYPKVDLGPARELHRKASGSDDVLLHATPMTARSRAAPRTSATTALLERRAELHDHLEPLRAPRLPGAAERPRRRTTRRRRSRARTGSRSR